VIGVQTVVVASDAARVRSEVAAVTAGPDIEVVEVTSGPAVIEAVHAQPVDMVIADMQIGNMGAMAICLELRLQESYGHLDRVPVLMLLDRRPDVFLARRAGAEGWLVKPLDPIRLRRAVRALLEGGTYADDSYQPVPVLVGTPQQDRTGALTSRT
jgi:DNA-binding response OmpR family regulator